MFDTHTLGRDTRDCQLCGSAPLDEFVVPGSSVLWHCRRCGLYQNGSAAPASAYEAGYHGGYLRHRKRKLRTAMLRLNRAAGLVPCDSPRLLDVGCSVGCTVEAAQQRGWQAVGVDVSQQAVSFCRQRGLDCHLVQQNELPFPDGSFDLLTAWHVIEHVADVTETLACWRRVLRPGGVLALETPDASCLKVRRLGARYRRFWAPEHTYTFTPETLGPFVQRCGFQLLQPPRYGRLTDLSPGLALYGLAYQAYHAFRRRAGLQKAFQLFAAVQDP